jgi:hypothetical protein
MMWLSDFWYEKLPLLYAAAGMAALVLLGRPAMLSAMLLFAAAALTGWWRYSHRR